MARTKKIKSFKHFKPTAFLKTLGIHCEKLRTKKGFSVNRLSDESDGLSPSAILRLEKGQAVTTSTLYRYAKVLEVPVRSLFDFQEGDEE